MGTSSSFNGPSGRNPLLPPWAQGGGTPPLPPPDAGEPDGAPPPPDGLPSDGGESLPPGDGDNAPDGPAPSPQNPVSPPVTLASVSWAAAKRGMTAYTSSRGDRGRLQGAANRYVGARGGGGTAARSAQAGRSSTARVGVFLSGVASRGFTQAATDLGLSAYLGRNVYQVLAAIANALAPDGATQEEAVARQAVNDTLAFLYERYGLEDGDLTKLDTMDREGVTEAVAVSVTSYVYHRWVQELGRKLEENAYTANEAVRLERDVRAFIEETVKLDMTRINPLTLDWGGTAGQLFVERIYRDAYEMLEGE